MGNEALFIRLLLQVLGKRQLRDAIGFEGRPELLLRFEPVQTVDGRLSPSLLWLVPELGWRGHTGDLAGCQRFGLLASKFSGWPSKHPTLALGRLHPSRRAWFYQDRGEKSSSCCRTVLEP